MRSLRTITVAAAIGCNAVGVRAETASDWINSVPEPPAAVGRALDWWEGGALRGPAFDRLQQTIDKERHQILTLNGGLPPSGELPEMAASASESERSLRAGYGRYLNGNSGKRDPETVLNKRTRWLQSAMGGRLSGVLGGIKPCPQPCQDPAVIAHNAPLLEQKKELMKQDLVQWRALFADWKKQRVAVVRRAQQSIDGIDYTTLEPAAKRVLARFRQALLRETELLLSITELAVRRSHSIATGSVDAVTGPSRRPASHQ